MSIVNTGISALGRLAALGLLAGAFLLGLAGVVYMSLQGSEVKVPEITGKNFSESEKELASLGLKIKKRADRFSAESPNTVIEQLPKPGETVKTGQLILVVISKGAGEGEGDERPTTLKNTTEEDDTEKIEEMISDKPKKPKANSNTIRKKADTARDVNGATGDSNSNSNSADSNSNKKDPGSNNNSSDKPNKNTQTPTINRLPNPAIKPPSGEPRVKPTIRP
ncbi:MAG: PASTA domain-containing protein [Pyrinomonadaceae bacterium]